MFLLLASCAPASGALASRAIAAQSPPIADTARVSFEQRWPAANPQWFELVIQPNGIAKYRSLPHPEPNSNSTAAAPEPYEFGFTLSPQSRQLIFSVAPRIRRLQGSLDKSKVAFTGTKTLRFEDGTGNFSVISYNYSASPDLAELTALMKGISQSIELSQTLKDQMRFDKLALDATLRQIEELLSRHLLCESQLFQPMLQRISTDPAVMNIARQRARRILQAQPATNSN